MKNLVTNTSSETTFQEFSKRNNRFLLFKPIHPYEDIKRLKDVANGQHPFTKSLFIN